MRNRYLAKVLVANKFVEENLVREFLGKVSPSKDLGMLLCEAGHIDDKTYRRVLAYVIQLEEKANATAAKPQQTTATSAKSGGTFGRTAEPQAQKTPQAPSVQKARNAEEEVPALQIEGNSLYGSSSSSSIQVEEVAGLESTRVSGGFQMATSEDSSEEQESSGALPVRFALNTGEGEIKVPESITSANAIAEMIVYARACQATDIYLFEKRPVVFRRFGVMVQATPDNIVAERLNDWLLEASKGFADFYVPAVGKNFSRTFALAGTGRARLSVTWVGVTPFLSIRLIPLEPISFENLYLPDFCSDFINLSSGLVLIAGPASSGRSSTLAMYGEAVAASRYALIETVEKPVERLLQNPNGAIIQRGVGLHTVSGEVGIKTAIQEGADVLLFDSISNIEELFLLLSAANSGMLVFATATGNNTVSLLNRFLDSVPQNLRSSLAASLADLLKGIIVQHLIPVVGGEGLVLATESMKVSSTIANLLRKEEIAQIPAALSSAKGTAISLDDSLKMLVDSGYIEGVEAWKHAFDARSFASYRPGRN